MRKKSPRVDHRGARRKRHQVQIVPGTRLSSVTEARRALVATEHHQAVRDLAPGFIPSAYAEDGIIEAIENPELPHVLAVQWHPERLRHSQVTRRLFRTLVELAADHHGNGWQ